MTRTYQAIETTYYDPDTGEIEELEYYVYVGKDDWIPKPQRHGQKHVQITVEEYKSKSAR